MIVVDTNVIAALVLPTSERTDAAIALFQADRDWVAPLLWRSEFTNILATGVRNGWLELDQAIEALSAAEEMMDGGDYAVPADEVLRLAASSGCTGYDSEFVVLARDLSVRLATLDRRILREFPDFAVRLDDYATPEST